MLKKIAMSWVLSGVALFSVAAHATNVPLTTANFNTWQSFDVNEDAAALGVDPRAWVDNDVFSAGYGTVLNFTFTLGSSATLRIVDSGFAGDVFQIFDNGTSLGFTSPATDTFGGFARGTQQSDFDAAFGDSRFSSAEFVLGAGIHSITGLLFSTTAPFNVTSGGIQIIDGTQVSPVPLPPAIWAFISGLGMLFTAMRRRSK